MMHLVLGIGYDEREYIHTRDEWKKHNVDIVLVNDIAEIISVLTEQNVVCVIVCSNSPEYFQYIDVIQGVKPVPVVVMTPEYSVEERAKFIDMGAKEYLAKNSQSENSINSDLDAVDFYLQLNYKGEQPLTIIVDKDLYFCLEYRTVRVQNQEIELTRMEFDALHLLLRNKKRVLTFEMIYAHVWGEEYIYNQAKAVTNLMTRLRNKLKITHDSPGYIKGVRSVGYKFDPR